MNNALTINKKGRRSNTYKKVYIEEDTYSLVLEEIKYANPMSKNIY